ncbi:hypothetical protein [Mycobacterium malmoense]|uniref:hypothetical protein n=1 Tax=Mycobacterium malmoense TaxID=1780 RepID=UPI0011471B68|nr:hypothetical protein [Mycobacterium malmoense]
MIDTKSPLSWKRIAQWDLSPRQQALYIATGCDTNYEITRAGTADKPSWTLYVGRVLQERVCVSNRLRDVKSYAQALERKALLFA